MSLTMPKKPTAQKQEPDSPKRPGKSVKLTPENSELWKKYQATHRPAPTFSAVANAALNEFLRRELGLD